MSSRGHCFGVNLNLPENCIKLLGASCTDKTWKQYNSCLNKYINFCNEKCVNPWKPEINIILQFLTSLYEQGLSYVSLNTTRSALSTFLGDVEGQSIGCHPLVTRLIKGVSRLRPQTPKYESTWDASQVLVLLKSWQNNDTLDLSKLSMKLVSLLALCSAQRVQTLCSIKLPDIEFTKDNTVNIKIYDRLKTSKPGSVFEMNFSKFSDSKLCIVRCIRCYIDRTQSVRDSEYLLISSRSPYKKVSSQTVSNWLKKILNESGIDSSKFGSHSFRHSSTSKASSLGISTDVIFKSAGWSSKSKVFGRFYNRPIIKCNEFANAILSSSRM
jgi:site-specific recombinase XerD